MNNQDNVPAVEPDEGSEFVMPEGGMWVQARFLVPGIRIFEAGPLGPWRPACTAHTREPEGNRPGVTQLILTGPGTPDSRRRFYNPGDELVIQRPDLSGFPQHAKEEAPDVLAHVDRRLARIRPESVSLTPARSTRWRTTSRIRVDPRRDVRGRHGVPHRSRSTPAAASAPSSAPMS